MTNIANNIPALPTEERSLDWYRERIDYLSTFMTEERFALFRQTLAMRTSYMTILTENTFHPHNAAALIRHCEAFGVQRMHTIETRCQFDPSQNISRGSDRWLNLVRHTSTSEALSALKAEGYRLVATTPHRESCTPETFDVTKGKFALIFGTEHAGISDEVIAEADEFLKMPMCGMVESLKVSASAAILVYMLSERMRHEVEGWQLSDEEYHEILYRWSRESVRDDENVLKRQYGDDF